MIAPSGAFAKHEAIVRAMRRAVARRQDIFAFPLLPHELREIAQLQIGINPAKSGDIMAGILHRVPLPN